MLITNRLPTFSSLLARGRFIELTNLRPRGAWRVGFFTFRNVYVE